MCAEVRACIEIFVTSKGFLGKSQQSPDVGLVT